jgi:preprotein translocase subunit SecE
MKKEKQTPQKNEDFTQKDSAEKNNRVANSNAKPPQKKQIKQKPVWNIRKKSPEKRVANDRAILGHIDKARQFLRDSKTELKKVKWPTKKELLASTAVVIFLSLLMALYFGIVDFGLIKIIKVIMQ